MSPLIEPHDDIDGVCDPLIPPASPAPWQPNGWRMALVPVDESGASAGAAVGGGDDRALIEAEARRAGVVWDASARGWRGNSGLIVCCPSRVRAGWWIDDDVVRYPSELAALRALPSCDAWTAEQSAALHEEVLADLATQDRAQVAALGVVIREVPHSRMVDGYTPSQRTRALEALLRHHDRRVVDAAIEALRVARG